MIDDGMKDVPLSSQLSQPLATAADELISASLTKFKMFEHEKKEPEIY